LTGGRIIGRGGPSPATDAMRKTKKGKRAVPSIVAIKNPQYQKEKEIN
jgi:hypothetical protein